MARVLGVHGIGQQLEGSATLVAAWGPAMRSGVELAGGVLAEDGLACVFYGDLFRPSGTKSLGVPRYGPEDVQDEFERELLEALWIEAAAVDEQVVAPEAQTKLRTPNLVQRALAALSHSRFFADVAVYAMIADLKQVRAYLHDDAIRQACLQRVADKVDEDTRVIVGHSLGSVIAYEALCANPHWPVHTYVSLGSPLGIDNLVFDLLRPAPVKNQGARPAGIKAWANVADGGDVVALRKDLDPLFEGTITDRLVDNGAKAHAIAPYLTARETGAAILAGLGG